METQKNVNLLNGNSKKTQNLQQTNGILLIVNQMVIIHTIINKIFNKMNRIKSL